MTEPARKTTGPGPAKGKPDRPVERIDEVRSLVRKTMPGYVAKLLGKDADVQRFVYMFMNAIEGGPADLVRCTNGSLARAMLLAAEVRLEVGRGPYPHAYLIPYWNSQALGKDQGAHEAQLQISVWGYTELVRRAGVRKVWADVVCEADEFECISGTAGKQIVHKPNWFGTRADRGHVLGSYACALLENGETVFEPVSREELETARAQNRGKSPAWDLWFEQQCQKVALKRLSKYLPKGDQADRALLIDEDPNTKPTIDVPGLDVTDRDGGSVRSQPAQGPLDQAVADAKAADASASWGTPPAASGVKTGPGWVSSSPHDPTLIDRDKLFAMLVDADERWASRRSRVDGWDEVEALSVWRFLRVVLHDGPADGEAPPEIPACMRIERDEAAA